ncbi:hypothetical protein N7516_007855 [Penicillium verrucosum]|uniref:uncharacterized protein n=1 Tax=Penicillium verrucosum TaxID=60171 RepID=UPI00254508B0|nr:uncharacterized protein N7516_007855 [Penicillium verrucosum]KAJ5926082.1 hypothetical protein N7516_007855 [Penicillium verrucosum]
MARKIVLLDPWHFYFPYSFGLRLDGRDEGDVRDFIGCSNNLAYRLLETALEAVFVAEPYLLTADVPC